MSTVLLLGAAGFVGSAAARWLLSSGHDVIAFVRDPDRVPPSLRDRARVETGDILDPVRVRAAASGATHAIYAVSVRPQDMSQAVAQNLAAVRSALDALDGLVQGFAMASGTSVWEFDDGAWHDESEPRNATGMIGRMNIALEDQLRARAAAGFPGCIVNIAGVYGPGRLNLESFRNGTAVLPGDGSNWTNVIHVDDAGQVLARAALAGQPGRSYIAVDDEPAPLRDIMELRARLAGGSVQWMPVPEDPSTLPPLQRMLLPLARSARFRNTRARTELGFQPAFPTYREGTPDAVERERSGASW